jgi:hypothetical protein
MNERIRLLAEQAGFVLWQDESWNPGDVIDWSCRYDDEFKKFAELIVRETIMEMATQMDEFGDDQSNNPVWYKSEKAVKKYFGVER